MVELKIRNTFSIYEEEMRILRALAELRRRSVSHVIGALATEEAARVGLKVAPAAAPPKKPQAK